MEEPGPASRRPEEETRWLPASWPNKDNEGDTRMSGEVLLVDLSPHEASEKIFGIIAALLKKCEEDCKHMQLL